MSAIAPESCIKCGVGLRVGAKFCESCGSPLEGWMRELPGTDRSELANPELIGS